MSISLFMRRRATIWRARDLAGGARGPAGMGVVVVEVLLGWVGDGEGDWVGGEGGPGNLEGGVPASTSSTLSSSTGRGGRGAGR